MTKEKNLTGFPSIDKPWLKYYDTELINNTTVPDVSVYNYGTTINKWEIELFARNSSPWNLPTIRNVPRPIGKATTIRKASWPFVPIGKMPFNQKNFISLAP